MPASVRLARRTVLAGAAVLLGVLAQPYAPTARDGAAHEATQAFLALLAAHPAAAAARATAMAATEAALPPSVREAIRAGAEAASASYRDYLAFCALEALPLPADALSAYVPRLLAFVVPRQGAQGSVVGAAWLPGIAPVEWQSEGGVAGLAFGGRPGWAIGAGNGIVAAVASGPERAYLGPGVPPPLATRHCLLQGRSGSGALATLTALRPCRAAAHVVYDAVEARLTVATSGADWRTEAPGGLAVVLAPDGDDAAASGLALRRTLEANHGWLGADKALALLQRAVPGADYLVLDVDAGTGTLLVGGADQTITL
ncbi:MAG: hypothetical protein ACYC5O_04325 [Anaerolineae bacterium]